MLKITKVLQNEKFKRLMRRFTPLMLFWLAFAFHCVFAAFMELSLPESTGFLAGILYTPAMLLFSVPRHQFIAMLVTNSLFAALIPVLVYKIAVRLGVARSWQRLLAALIAGVYPAVFTRTKFVGGGTLNLFFPFVIALLLLTCADTKNKAGKAFLAMLLALLTTVAVFSDARMLAIAMAVVLVIIVARFEKKNIVPLAVFFVSLAVFSLGIYLFALHLKIPLTISSLFAGGIAVTESVKLVSAHLYYFAASTWGLGVLGLVLFAKLDKKTTKEDPQLSNHFIFSAFAFFSLVACMTLNVLYTPEEYTDNITPLFLIFVVCNICMYELNLRSILSTTVILGGVFTYFFLSPSAFRELAYIENGISEFGSVFQTVSVVFCMMALLIVLVCCGGRYRIKITTAAIAAVSVYSCVYVCAVYLPYERNRTLTENAPIYELSEQIHNSQEAPPVIVPPQTAQLLQFLNSQADIRTEIGDLDSYFLVDEDLQIHIVGEKAVLYALSQE
jgi:hypothetical protein